LIKQNETKNVTKNRGEKSCTKKRNKSLINRKESSGNNSIPEFQNELRDT